MGAVRVLAPEVLDAVRQAASILREEGLQVVIGNQVVEGRPPLDWHKGQAVLHILRERHGSINGYLIDAGLEPELLETLRGRLLEP